MIAGIDGFRGGWVAAIDRGDGTTTVRAFSSFAEVLAETGLRTIVIDMPIGLLERGPRRCDELARRLLGRWRASSVFPAPIRPMLAARSWAEACAIRFASEGRRCSRQVVNILPKIREVDELMTPALQGRVFEGHPEVSFALLAGGGGLRTRKTTPAGRAERLALLRPHFPDLGQRLAEQRSELAADILDAYALLWTARRLPDRVLRLPAEPQHDPRGLRAEIVA